jgi:aspartyl-tRNA synthetase
VKYSKKTHTCGELRLTHLGQEVTLAGWVNRRRVHGGVNFVDLRDRFGLVQVVSDPEADPAIHQALEEVRPEWVIQVVGVVRARPAGLANPNMPTGDIEVLARQVRVLNAAKTPPITISKEEDEDEATRLHYRYLDLRRERMRHLTLRHRSRFIRGTWMKLGFIEVERPFCSTARRP